MIFVFGSNELDIHAGGAARFAKSAMNKSEPSSWRTMLKVAWMIGVYEREVFGRGIYL